ncbi:dentin sialophosphoprotein-like, partial [Temnothorax curvispinosus]|uniref:Dentin sialophosphoprotein-like n=1 Tax=Temnothorax curvispinosus TaxID=300111 RepID=A0A6J1PEU7_9HYME
MRELGRIIRAYASQRHRAWSRIVRRAEEVINHTRHASHGYAPCELNDGEAEQAWADKVETARRRLAEAARKRKIQADKHGTAEYTPGQQVWVKRHRRSDASRRLTRKIHLVYEGPYRVREVIRPNAYLIEDLDGQTIGVFNARQLKPNRLPRLRGEGEPDETESDDDDDGYHDDDDGGETTETERESARSLTDSTDDGESGASDREEDDNRRRATYARSLTNSANDGESGASDREEEADDERETARSWDDSAYDGESNVSDREDVNEAEIRARDIDADDDESDNDRRELTGHRHEETIELSSDIDNDGIVQPSGNEDHPPAESDEYSESRWRAIIDRWMRSDSEDEQRHERVWASQPIETSHANQRRGERDRESEITDDEIDSWPTMDHLYARTGDDRSRPIEISDEEEPTGILETEEDAPPRGRRINAMSIDWNDSEDQATMDYQEFERELKPVTEIQQQRPTTMESKEAEAAEEEDIVEAEYIGGGDNSVIISGGEDGAYMIKRQNFAQIKKKKRMSRGETDENVDDANGKTAITETRQGDTERRETMNTTDKPVETDANASERIYKRAKCDNASETCKTEARPKVTEIEETATAERVAPDRYRITHRMDKQNATSSNDNDLREAKSVENETRECAEQVRNVVRKNKTSGVESDAVSQSRAMKRYREHDDNDAGDNGDKGPNERPFDDNERMRRNEVTRAIEKVNKVLEQRRQNRQALTFAEEYAARLPTLTPEDEEQAERDHEANLRLARAIRYCEELQQRDWTRSKEIQVRDSIDGSIIAATTITISQSRGKKPITKPHRIIVDVDEFDIHVRVGDNDERSGKARKLMRQPTADEPPKGQQRRADRTAKTPRTTVESTKVMAKRSKSNSDAVTVGSMRETPSDEMTSSTTGTERTGSQLTDSSTTSGQSGESTADRIDRADSDTARIATPTLLAAVMRSKDERGEWVSDVDGDDSDEKDDNEVNDAEDDERSSMRFQRETNTWVTYEPTSQRKAARNARMINRRLFENKDREERQERAIEHGSKNQRLKQQQRTTAELEVSRASEASPKLDLTGRMQPCAELHQPTNARAAATEPIVELIMPGLTAAVREMIKRERQEWAIRSLPMTRVPIIQ